MSIYQEHLAESGFLLSERSPYFHDPELSWQDVDDLESRLEAHIDALDSGGELARQCALELLTYGDEDELLGASYLLTTIDNINLDAVIEAFINADEDMFPSYVDAFKCSQHPELTDKLIPLLENDRALVRAACAEVLGYRREGDPKRIWPLLHDEDETVRAAAIIGLMRFDYREALPALEQVILESDNANLDEPLLALLALGSVRALELMRFACMNSRTASECKLICLAWAGNQDDFNTLNQAISFPDMAAVAFQALGVFGTLNVVPILLQGLQRENEQEKLAAADALNAITGAGLKETIIMIEEEEPELEVEDILGTEKEEDAVNEEESLPPPHEIEVHQSVSDFSRWNTWWQQNYSQFQLNIRYRNGKPFDLSCCIEEIANPSASFQSRQLAYMELLIRSGHHIPFEPDWLLSKQFNAIQKWRSWWEANKNNYMNNQWCFNGS